MERLYAMQKEDAGVFAKCEDMTDNPTHRYLLFYAVRGFMEDFESLVIRAITDDPMIAFDKLVDIVYAEFIQRVPEELYAVVAGAVPQKEFAVLVEAVIAWTPPPYKKSRPFEECVMALCPGIVREIPGTRKPEDPGKKSSTKKSSRK